MGNQDQGITQPVMHDSASTMDLLQLWNVGPAHRPQRTLHYSPHDEGLVTFLVDPPDDLVLVVRIQWLGD
jgi:hypothetical protein